MARAGRSAAGRTRRTGALAAAAGGLAVTLALSACAGTTTSAEEAQKLAHAQVLAESRAAAGNAASGGQAAGAAGASPAEQPAEPLVTATPDEHSLVGDLVEGFPIDLLPVPADAVILVTSAVPVGDADVQQVSLNLRTAARASALMSMYRTALVSAGFTEVPAAEQTDLAAEASFVRSGGDELVTIGVLDVDGARTVSIGGRVHTESD